VEETATMVAVRKQVVVQVSEEDEVLLVSTSTEL
jgi:hypothetical protein